jgi:putative oxidoreductase
MRLPELPRWTHDIGLLILRLTVPAMMLFGHGLSKLTGFAEKMNDFPDPLGVGSTMSLALAVFGEFFASIFLALGLFTRAMAVPFLITMLVAALVIHASDPWQRKEFALLYAIPALVLIFTGAGRFSLDALIFEKKLKS